MPLLDLYRRPTEDDRSLLALAPGELIVAVSFPRPPDASAYERLGERAAFSFALVSVAAARRGDDVRLVAAGVANIPRRARSRGPARRTRRAIRRRAGSGEALTTLAERALAAVA